MVRSFNKLLEEIEARLPELEWKISNLGEKLNLKSLPRGLFSVKTDLKPSACIEEIKKDIRLLASQNSYPTAYYLAARISQKIAVLVNSCQLQINKPANPEKVYFGIQSLTTRQCWLQELEQQIMSLTQQKQALENALAKIDKANVAATLNLGLELGEIEKRLTSAKETFFTRSS